MSQSKGRQKGCKKGGWGLVSDFVHDEIFHDHNPWYDPRRRENAEHDPNLWYYRTDKIRDCDDTLVVSMPHPNRSAKKWALELEKVLAREMADKNLKKTVCL